MPPIGRRVLVCLALLADCALPAHGGNWPSTWPSSIPHPWRAAACWCHLSFSQRAFSLTVGLVRR